jgi:hypothetical protein
VQGQVAGQYKKDRGEFERTAKFWTEMYASPQKKFDIEAAVKKVSLENETERDHRNEAWHVRSKVALATTD